jgi:F0F1-type ATP synthase assembly protein I
LLAREFVAGYMLGLGIGHVVAGMARQGYDLELRRYDG